MVFNHVITIDYIANLFLIDDYVHD